MAFGGSSRGGLRGDINVTPLVDVCLVLLIIFMVVTPMLHRGKEMALPKATKTDQEEEKANPIVVSVTKDGKLWLENDAYAADSLGPALAAELEKTPGRKILLRGDEQLTVGDVRKVMDLARLAGAKGVALAVQEKK